MKVHHDTSIDYLSREDGPTILVPGSHRDRMPRGHESFAHVKDHDYIKPIPLEGPAGSLAVWNGAMWHGSSPRTAEGMRITLPYVYGRSYLQPIHTWTEALKEGDNNKWMEKYPELEKVLGLWHPYPTDRYGPDVPAVRDERNTNMRMAGDNIYA